MRSLLIALALLCAAPVLAQTPPPQTITFEGIGTPVPYEPGERVPASARLKEVPLAGGGIARFRTRGGAGYVALVTHFGTTVIAPVSKKGLLLGPEQRLRFLEIRLRKARGARLDSWVPIQAGLRVDNKGTTNDTTDDEKFYDADGGVTFFLYTTDKRIFPASGGQLSIARIGADPLNLVKDPYDFTTTLIDFGRLLVAGTCLHDDFVISFGH